MKPYSTVPLVPIPRIRHTLSTIAIVLCLVFALAISAAAKRGSGGRFTLFKTSQTAVDSAQPDSKMLQFTSGGQIVGFEPRSVYVASGSHALHVEVVKSFNSSPASEAPIDNASPKTANTLQKAPALSKVTYANLWPGVTLSYDAPPGAVVRSNYPLEPHANPDSIKLRYNAPVAVETDGSLRISFKTGAMT